MSKNGRNQFCDEYPKNTKNIKTGEHFEDKYGNIYTVFISPNISLSGQADGKRFLLINWTNESKVYGDKELLCNYLNMNYANKVTLEFAYSQDVEEFTVLSDGENKRIAFDVTGSEDYGLFSLVNMQKYEVTTANQLSLITSNLQYVEFMSVKRVG